MLCSLSEPMAQHLVGVQPLGACFQSDCVNVRNSGLGKLACFSDEQILAVLSCLGARDLIRLSSVSKALYCFANHEELWKSLVIEVRDVDDSTSCRSEFFRTAPGSGARVWTAVSVCKSQTCAPQHTTIRFLMYDTS